MIDVYEIYHNLITQRKKSFSLSFCKIFATLWVLFSLSFSTILAQDPPAEVDIPSDSSTYRDSSWQSHEQEGFTLRSVAHWEDNSINIELTIPIEDLKLQTRYFVNGVIESNFSVWLYDSVKNLQINSRETLQDFWGRSTFKNPYTFFKTILQRKHSVFYPNLKSFRAVYEINFYPNLVQVWLGDDFQNEDLPSAIINNSASAYTGLLIYAGDALPIRGEPYITRHINPSIFPRIYDKNLQLILSYRNISSDILLQRGVLSYDMQKNAEQHKNLIGAYPLRILARELFGTARTDIIIGNADANQLLQNSHMRKVLQEGRILVLLGAESATTLYDE